MNVLIVLEDFRYDQYILKPMIVAMLKALNKPRAKVRVCQNPLLRGISEALKWERIAAIIDSYAQVDLFLLCVDRDGDADRQQKLQNLEHKAKDILVGRERILLAENAWQEIEVWVLAGHDLPKRWNWKEIRNEIDPKETYFDPFVEHYFAGNQSFPGPGNGRKSLAAEAARHYDRIRQRCPEDVANLENRIRDWLS